MKTIKAGAIAALALVAGLGVAHGQTRQETASPPVAKVVGPPAKPLATVPVSPAAAPALTKADVDLWLDGYMPYALRTGDIPGAKMVSLPRLDAAPECPPLLI